MIFLRQFNLDSQCLLAAKFASYQVPDSCIVVPFIHSLLKFASFGSPAAALSRIMFFLVLCAPRLVLSPALLSFYAFPSYDHRAGDAVLLRRDFFFWLTRVSAPLRVASVASTSV